MASDVSAGLDVAAVRRNVDKALSGARELVHLLETVSAVLDLGDTGGGASGEAGGGKDPSKNPPGKNPGKNPGKTPTPDAPSGDATPEEDEEDEEALRAKAVSAALALLRGGGREKVQAALRAAGGASKVSSLETGQIGTFLRELGVSE